ncbi:hypothetical protein [Burkholderia gladioli]|uniref:hypothetical protein n=1 Tax=Burkholderia gladioli TaxID=28095 RepID=UPI0016405246|nr:hypothetical protein [Burkholderia gladioli]
MSRWKAIVNDWLVIFESCLGRGANQIEPVIFREKSKESDYGRLRSGLARAGCGTDHGDRGSGRATDEAISPGRRASLSGRIFPARPPSRSRALADRSASIVPTGHPAMLDIERCRASRMLGQQFEVLNAGRRRCSPRGNRGSPLAPSKRFFA